MVLLAILGGGCVGPVDENAPDYSEFESVWQYLKVYSIYQDRVPEDPFVFKTCDSLLRSVADTLNGFNYTDYVAGSASIVTSETSLHLIPRVSPGEDKPVSFGRTAGLELRKTVFFDSLTDSTACIRIKHFTQGEIDYDSAGKLVRYDYTSETFLEILSEVAPFPNIIIDLRANGGGAIDEATNIIDAFLPFGTSYILAREREYQMDTRTARTLEWHAWKTVETARFELREKKVVILMDGNSASASEIVIAALKDGPTGATLVGTRSYGKGIGQIRLQRRDRPMLQITFLQLKGISERTGAYHHIGIEPDIFASGLSDQWLLTAVQVHEPGVTRLPSLRKQSHRAAFAPAGYRIVYEE